MSFASMVGAMAAAYIGHVEPTSNQVECTMKILAVGTLKALIEEQSSRIFPKEVPATLKLYLGGKLEQFWLRDEMKGAVFILNVESVSEAESLLGELPLTKENLHTFDFFPMGPLLPLGFLIQ
jgi:hypothetical protein